MADLKEDIAFIIGSVLAGTGAFLSWFYQSGLLGTVTGIVIGAGITYFVQTRTQKRLWKREYTVKITEQVYGELFGEIKNILNCLENDYLRQIVIQGKWSHIQNDHRYFMVDKRFREEIDSFFKSVEKYNSDCYTIEAKIIPIIIKNQLEVNFKKTARSLPQLVFSYWFDKQRIDTGISVESNLRELKTFKEIEQNELQGLDSSKVTNRHFIIRVVDAYYYEIDDNDPRVSAYWDACLKSLREDKTFASLPTEKQNLLKQTTEIKSSLEKRISEPWKV
jgi:hypothetical protein